MTQHGLVWVRAVYLGCFVGTLVFLLYWEEGNPKLPFSDARQRRRHVLRNLGMLFWVVVIADVIVGEGLLNAEDYLLGSPHSLLNAGAQPLFLQFIMAFAAADLLDYALHRAAHHLSWLWRLHAAHHSDPHLDASTGARFHPLEVSINAAVKIAFFAVSGLPLWIEGVRVILLNSFLFIQHANVDFPPGIERLRWLLITPGIHRLHHNPETPFINSNYGMFFSFWDRIFGTFRAPLAGQGLDVGLKGCDLDRWQSVSGMLATPFMRDTPSVPK